MRAVRVNEWRQPVQLEEMPKLAPGRDEVLVRVRAASVNPVDKKITAGYLADYFPKPLTLGRDFAGDVEAVGEDVQAFKPGDAVFGMTSGSFADYVAVKESDLAAMPRSLDYVQSAAIVLTGLCAWQSLFDVGGLQSGERVLIHGAAGGVGIPAVQLAKNAGAHVVVHGRNGVAAITRELGADEFIDSESQRFEDAAGDVDVVLDLIGDEYAGRSMDFCRPGARYVTPAAFFAPDEGEKRGITATSVATQPSGPQLAHLAEEIDAGRLRVIVERTFPLEEAQQALDYRLPPGAFGKVVLTMD
jgi:NADPH:quinone reductase-like Zn-dependent oxidoreductase